MAELRDGVIYTDIEPKMQAKLQEALEIGLGDIPSIEDMLLVFNWAENVLERAKALRSCMKGKAYLMLLREEDELWCDKRVDWNTAPVQSVKEAERIFAETRRKIGFTMV